MATLSAERLTGCSTWLSCGPVEAGAGVLFMFPFDLTWEQYEAVADTADTLVPHLRDDGEFGCPRDDLFWISHEELLNGALQDLADRLGAALALPSGAVVALRVREAGRDWLTVEPLTHRD